MASHLQSLMSLPRGHLRLICVLSTPYAPIPQQLNEVGSLLFLFFLSHLS